MPNRNAKFKTITDYRQLSPGTEIWDGVQKLYSSTDGRFNMEGPWVTCWRGVRVYCFRSGTVPGIRKYKAGGGKVQRHRQQLCELDSTRTPRQRISEWGADFDTVRVDACSLDPWDNECRYSHHRGYAKNWKHQRRTRYRYPSIDRRIHSPAYWNSRNSA